MKKIVIATTKSWNIECAKVFQELHPEIDTKIITQKKELMSKYLNDFKPDYVFFPHWSWMISESIYENFECVVFHMTDLPYGRGGSPLQNLIVRGHKHTMISAIKVTQGLDEGPIYFKENLSLEGSANEIFKRASEIIFLKMIPQFLTMKLLPVPQEGTPVVFKRRQPKDSEILEMLSIEQIYDYIRMLDAEGYPNAYIKYGNYRLEFTEAVIKKEQVEAKVRFKKVTDE